MSVARRDGVGSRRDEGGRLRKFRPFLCQCGIAVTPKDPRPTGSDNLTYSICVSVDQEKSRSFGEPPRIRSETLERSNLTVFEVKTLLIRIH